MRVRTGIGVVALVLVMGRLSPAQEGFALRAAGEVLLPVGADAVPTAGYGVNVGGHYDTGGLFAFGATIGYNFWGSRPVTFEVWPVHLYVNAYAFKSPGMRGYFMTEGGVNFRRSTTESVLGAGMGLDLPLVDPLAFDISVRYERILTDQSIGNIGIRAAFTCRL